MKRIRKKKPKLRGTDSEGIVEVSDKGDLRIGVHYRDEDNKKQVKYYADNFIQSPGSEETVALRRLDVRAISVRWMGKRLAFLKVKK